MTRHIQPTATSGGIWTYYRLGKNRPGSGILCLTSRSALSLKVRAAMPIMTPMKAAVFTFQFEGWAYQPPEGDQTCLGYLKTPECQKGIRSWEKRRVGCRVCLIAYFTRGPPPF